MSSNGAGDSGLVLPNRAMTLSDLATLAGVARRTIERYVEKKQLVVVHYSKRCTRVLPAAARAFLAQLQAERKER